MKPEPSDVRADTRQPATAAPGTFPSPEARLTFKKHLAFNAALALVLAILAGVGWLSYRNMTAASEADHWTTHTYLVIEELDRLFSSLKDAETGERGFVLTGNPKYLEPYQASLREIGTHLDALRRLTADSPLQQHRLAAITPLVASKLAELKETVAIREAKGFQTADEEVMTDVGENIMDKIRVQVAGAEQEEEQLLKVRAAAKEAEKRNTLHTVLLGDTLGGVALLLLVGSLNLELARRRRAEIEVRASEQEFRSLAEAMPQIVWAARADGWNIYFNQQWVDYTGMTLEESYGHGWNTPFHPDDKRRAWEAWQRATQCNERYSLECRLRRADGAYRWWLVRGVPMLGANGEILKWFGTCTDIEELKHAEAALQEGNVLLEQRVAERTAELRESEKKYRNLFQNMAEEVHFWELVRDEHGTIKTWRLVDANPAALKTWGKSLGEIQGKSTDEIFGAGAEEHYMPVVRKIMTEGAPHSFEDYFPHIDKHFRFTSVPLGDDYFITTGADITGIVRAQDEIRKLNAELEDRIRLRTAELQISNQELEAFCYSVSHDLRAPLRGINGFSKALMEDYADKLDATGMDFLERIGVGCQRMAQLIDDLLKLSRLSRSEMRRQPVNLSNLAREVADDLQATEPDRTVEFQIPEGVTSVGDPDLLRVALSNLLGNAWKFTGKRPDGLIEFGVRRPENDSIYFVRDNGSGFDMAHTDKLFQPFQRLHGMKEFPGTGIGLAIVGRVIRRHGGRIWAEAAPGQGATFHFTLEPEGESHG